MQGLIRTALVAGLLACGAVHAQQQEQAQPAQPPQQAQPAEQPSAAVAPRFAAPASFAAAPVPKAEDTNAQRTRSQPGNNAPFWRGVHDSGTQSGLTSLPGAEKGEILSGDPSIVGAKVG